MRSLKNRRILLWLCSGIAGAGFFATVLAKPVATFKTQVEGEETALLGGTLITQEMEKRMFPNLLQLECDGAVGSAVVFSPGKALTAAHLTPLNARCTFGGSEIVCVPHPCFKELPRNWDVAVCISSKFEYAQDIEGRPIETILQFGAMSNELGPIAQTVVVAGYGCTNPKCGTGVTAASSRLSHGFVQVDGMVNGSKSMVRAVPASAKKCTVICWGDSGGPVYARRSSPPSSLEKPYLEVIGLNSQAVDKTSHLSMLDSKVKDWLDDPNFDPKTCLQAP